MINNHRLKYRRISQIAFIPYYSYIMSDILS